MIRVSEISCLTDAERRLLLATFGREERLCRSVDSVFGNKLLSQAFCSLKEKIKAALKEYSKKEEST